MNKSNSSSEVNFSAYKGEHFQFGLKDCDNNNLKFLFIGGFHYCFPKHYKCTYYNDDKNDRVKLPDDCLQMHNDDCPEFQGKGKKLSQETVEAIKDHISDMESFSSTYEDCTKNEISKHKYHVPTTSVFSSFYTFFNDKCSFFTEEDIKLKYNPKTSIWNYIAFTNYIQRHIEGRNFFFDNSLKQSEIILKEKDGNDLNRRCLENLIKTLNPDVIVVLSYNQVNARVKMILSGYNNGSVYNELSYLNKENVYYIYSKENTAFAKADSLYIERYAENCLSKIINKIEESTTEKKKSLEEILKKDKNKILSALWIALINKDINNCHINKVVEMAWTNNDKCAGININIGGVRRNKNRLLQKIKSGKSGKLLKNDYYSFLGL